MMPWDEDEMNSNRRKVQDIMTALRTGRAIYFPTHLMKSNLFEVHADLLTGNIEIKADMNDICIVEPGIGYNDGFFAGVQVVFRELAHVESMDELRVFIDDFWKVER